jgi:hypothetical protein
MPADKDSFRRPYQPAGRVAELLSKLSQLRGLGPGAGLGVLIQDLLLPPQSRRVKRDEHPAEAYPQPDRLRHPMSQARFGAGMERPAPRRPSYEEPSRARLATPLSRDHRKGRTTRPLAKGSAIRRAQGAFHR